MRSVMLALLLASSYATAGFITSSTSGNATVSATVSSSSIALMGSAFSNGPTAAIGKITFTDAFTLFGIDAGIFRVTISSGYNRLDGYGNTSASVGPASFGFVGGPTKIETFDIPFLGSQPISIVASLSASAIDFEPDNPFVGSAQIGIYLSISNFGVFDAAGTELLGVNYATESGDPLPFAPPASVPEPGTWLLSAVGLAIIARHR